MTRLSDQDLNKLERALAEAHRSRQEPALGEDWARHVMRDIRQGAAGHRGMLQFTGIDLLVWRAAAVAAVLAMSFAGSVLVHTGQDTVELASLLSDAFEAGEPLIE